jgi:hypothetical protein
MRDLSTLAAVRCPFLYFETKPGHTSLIKISAMPRDKQQEDALFYRVKREAISTYVFRPYSVHSLASNIS